MGEQPDLTTRQAALVADGAELARAAALRNSLDAKKDLGRLLVNLRETFQDDQGRPDYTAKTQAYRTAVAALYEAAGLSREDSRRVQGAVRHQVGIELRRRLDADTLTAYDLNPHDRNAPRRKPAPRPDADQVDTPASLPDRVAELHALAFALVESPEASTLDAETAELVRAALADTAALCTRLRARLSPGAP
ncbi:hypothetical protein [Amycolatopsis sp. lyj-23]|uniref:hypothetical protein n=1 Tax=Amycolatopsis sp. lyj-23 TaxID=2789283 RepID=UPI003978278B